MKLVRSVPIILAIILFLTAFPGNSQTAASQDACTQPLTAASVENDWTSDCLSAQREGSYALFYTFYLRQQSDVTIFLRSPVDTYLYLYSGTDTSTQYIDHSADITNTNLNSRIERTLEAGAYTIEATTSGRQRTGHFTLETTGIDHSYRPDLSDRAALTALYNATDGPNWEENDNWLTDAPLYDWYSVETDDYGRVIELDLDDNNLSGQIPSELGRLSNLEDLNLYTNQLTGTIPTELDNLTNLRDLDLGNNHLSGQIPRELSNLTHLKSLLLDENELAGAIPPELGNLRELESLFLNDNQFTGHIPYELGNLINMENLWLNDNQFTGHIPSELGSLANLYTLLLGNNQLTGEIPPELGDLTELEELTLAGNDLTGCIPHTLRDVYDNDFDELNLSFCESPDRAALTALYNATDGPNWHSNENWLTDAPLSDWYGVDTNSEGRVTQLDLGTNKLSGTIPPEIGNLDEIDALYLSGNQLTGTLPTEMGNLTRLHVLTLENNRLWGEFPRSMTALTRMQLLVITTNNGLCVPDDDEFREWLQNIPPDFSRIITCNPPSTAPNAGDISVLTALYNATGGDSWEDNTNWLSEQPLQYWKGITINSEGRVTGLHFPANNLVGNIPPEIGNLTSLNYMRLDQNRLTGKIPAELGNLNALQSLHLYRNQLTGSIPAELGKLSNLERLRLEENRLTGSIPIEIGNLVKLRRLYLDDNRLSDDIPSELGKLVNLIYLDLDTNQLSGSVPDEFGNLTSLLSLDIHGNQLTGELPSQLTQLRNLGKLLFHNNAGLCAPADTAFQTWLQSIEYRGRICGAPPPGSDEAALIALYNATNGPNWHRNDNWLTDAPLSDWYGVSTNEHGYVTRLDLSDNNLVGTIPYELGNLFETEAALWLWLGGNQLTGCIPETLRNVNASDLARIDLPFCNNPDRDVLVAIYNATDGDNWANNTNWLTDAPLYKWHGVNTDGRWSVHELTLDNNQLAGQLPPEIGEFHAVKAIDLSTNQLTGTIPPELGNLHLAPVLIDLSDNQFTGEIPPELGNLDNLWGLELSNNQLTGTIPHELGELDDLEELYLAGNQLTGCIPDALREVEYNDYSELALPFCEDDTTTTPSPTQCSEHITNFATYDRTLTNDCASESRTEFGNHYARQFTFTLSHPTVVEVLLRSQFLDTYIFLYDDGKTIVDIDDYIGRNAGFRKALQPGAYTVEVTTFRSDQTGDFSITFGRPELDALKALYESAGGAGWARKHNWLSDTPLSEWQGIQTDSEGRVTQVILIANNLTGEIPSELQDLTHLEGLYLGRNELSGAIPAELGSLTALRSLLLSDNNLTGRIPAQLGKLEDLHELYLSRNQLSGPIPSTLGRLDNLHNLHLAANGLSDNIPAELGSLANLRHLSMSDNSLTGSIPPQLADLDKLTHLYLWGNELTSGSFFLRLGDMDSLQFLDIGGNRIAGAQMLPELEKLNNLTGLGLHDSGLTNSDLLDYMNDLQALDLEFLNLRSNDLSDPQILIGLSRITTLQRLAINDNKFSGQLPRSMTALTLMRIFYFNDNKGICAPADAEFQNWLTGIRDFLGPNCAAAGPMAAPAPASHSAKASAPEGYSPEDTISEAHSLSLLESIQPGD